LSKTYNMSRKLIYLVVAMIVVAGCKNERETPNGMTYQVHKEGNGVKPKVGEFLVFNYVLKDNKDSIWSNTWEEGIPAYQPISDTLNAAREDGMRQMMRDLSVGDSVSVTMTTKAFFKELVRAPVPHYIDTTGSLTYIISPTKITTEEQYFADREKVVARRDSTFIADYLQKNNIEAQADPSGMRYVIHNQTGGEKPTLENCVEVKYAGRFLKNGQTFDAAERAAFPLTNIIRGWTIALPMLGKGDSATFFIPSALAYGRDGYPGAIPPDAILEFKVTLLDVKKEFDRDTRTCK
jgi:FKBP-type peptidyl-prolyl cis-trans isomerase FkpA